MIRRKKNIITAHKDEATNMVSGASFNQSLAVEVCSLAAVIFPVKMFAVSSTLMEKRLN